MTLHRSNEDLEGHMNTGIEWPVYAYVGPQGEGEEVARLRAVNNELCELLVEVYPYLEKWHAQQSGYGERMAAAYTAIMGRKVEEALARARAT